MKNLTIDQMREIVAGASEYEKYWITQGEYHCHVLSFPNMTGQKAYKLNDFRAAIAEHDQNLSEQRERFEKAYSLKFPKSKVTLLPSGNYSGWIKQKKWKDWQVKEAQLQSELDCDHDWEDISTTADLERQLICTYCGLERSEPLELNAQRWTDGGEL